MAQLKLVKSVFTANPAYPATEDRIPIVVSLKNNGEFLDDGRLARFAQQFTTGRPEHSPFFLDVEFTALFALEPPPLPLERLHYVQKVFPRLVFPHLREYVAETTRRGGFAPLIVSRNLFDEEPEPEAESIQEQPKWMH
jgi:preprotein translocase subunit SecB